MGGRQHIFMDLMDPERKRKGRKNSLWWLRCNGKVGLLEDWTVKGCPPNSCERKSKCQVPVTWPAPHAMQHKGHSSPMVVISCHYPDVFGQVSGICDGDSQEIPPPWEAGSGQ